MSGWLEQVRYPADLRALPEESLYEFCDELRRFIIHHCSVHGGHFAASLGVVELTVALHYVFDTPKDLLVWDVGHQAYGHKIITGRRDRFHTNRIYKGISGFPKRSESEYDTFGVGHSSTSLSAALGMSIACQRLNLDKKVVAVIGDGAMTGGMAFEALNHAGFAKADVLYVLNDNCMSIDSNVGALMEYLVDLTSSRTYNKFRDRLWELLGRLPHIGRWARQYAARFEDLIGNALFSPGALFEALGFRYFGPIDGHDVNHLVRILRDLQQIRGPRLLHIKTVKGKGFAPAESDQTKWHAPAFVFDPATGLPVGLKTEAPAPPKYQDVFGETIIELAQNDERIVAVTPAMLSGSGLVKMNRLMPDRCFDVGIAEQHAVTFSAGMATQGLIPFCNIYSTFIQRGYDQVIHDVAIQDLKVIFCLDRAGLVGADGATHHGAFDIAFMRVVPNLIVSAPMDETQLRSLMYTAAHDSNVHPFVIRYPRGQGVCIDWRTPLELIPIGKGRKICDGETVAVLSYGHPGNWVVQAQKIWNAKGLFPAHYDLRFVKPLDEELLHEVFSRFERIVTIEDGCLTGGFGSAILEFMAEYDYRATVKRLGIPDRVVHHGTQQELYDECGYGLKALVECVEKLYDPVASRRP
ncbi:MAG: 1-deoxy-D-xylulose-5-phosphate synthase [Bacteroidia bacterium]|nr:1-deoxy-D-xylulose-5-phosphate synthase [Bacteroidia bacterium]